MSHALIFNAEDGSIHIEGFDFILRNGLAETDVRLALDRFFRSGLDHGNGYTWQMVQGFSLDGESASLALCFHLGKLNAVHVGVMLPGVVNEGGRPDREAIEREVAFLRASIGRQLSRSFEHGQEEFSWGSAWALFDAKDFSASAGLRYKA